MKRFVTDGPIIPREVLQAQEEGRLVIFCGAGISYYTGLPGYGGLTKAVFDACGFPLRTKRPRKSSGIRLSPYDRAYLDGQFDRALHLLEQPDACGEQMRVEALKILNQPPTRRNLFLHKALLQLSALPDGGNRLVTTNFDDRFQRASKALKRIQVAPRVSTPQIVSWRHLTYLHGLIDLTNDPRGTDLVLTSGDFGRAYLKDGWAARFVVELFREYTVLFVGYSLNDPIVGYLIDALAADMRPNGQFRSAYALAEHFDGDDNKKEVEGDWKAKNVIAIPFNKGKDSKNPDFSLFNKTLVEWARQFTGGMASRVGIAQSIIKPYVTGGPDEDRLMDVTWALSKPDGTVAKEFADASVQPDISWLAPLSEQKVSTFPDHADVSLFSLPSPPRSPDPKNLKIKGHHIAPVAGHGAACIPSLPLHPISLHLGRWISKHLATVEAITWVIARQGIVHPEINWFIEQELPKLHAPWRAFWTAISRGYMQPECDKGNVDHALYDATRKPEWEGDDDVWLLRGAESYLQVKKAYRLYENPDKPIRSVSDIARIDLILVSNHWVAEFQKKLDTPSYQAALLRLSDALTDCAARAFTLAQAAEIPTATVWTSIHVRAIRNFKDLRDMEQWSLYISLLCHALEISKKKDPVIAVSLVLRWAAIWNYRKLAMFRRLALYGISEIHDVPASMGLAILLEGAKETLWYFDCAAEIHLFLVNRAKDLSASELNTLFDALRSEPPPLRDGRDFPPDLAARTVAEHLAALRKGGITIPGDLDEKVDIPEEAELDEAAERPIQVGWVPLPSAERIVDLSIAEAMQNVFDMQDAYKAGHLFKDYILKRPDNAAEAFSLLVGIGETREEVFETGLSAFSEDAVRPVLPATLPAFLQIFASDSGLKPIILRAVSRLMDTAAESETLDEKVFFELWDRLWDCVAQYGGSSVIGEDTSLTAAINSPEGNLALALMQLLFVDRYKDMDSIPPSIMSRIEMSADGSTEANHFARTVYASRLLWLHDRNRSWTNQTIIRRMGESGPEAQGLWQGYFWTVRWNLPLFKDLKLSLVKFYTANIATLDDDLTRSFGQLIGGIGIYALSAIGPATFQKLLQASTTAALTSVIWIIERQFESANEKAATLWKNAVEAIFKLWPGAAQYRTEEISLALAGMLLHTREAFPDAFKLLHERRLMGPVVNSNFIYPLDQVDEEGKYNYAKEHPEEVLMMADILLQGAPMYAFEMERLKTLLTRIGETAPTLKKRREFTRLMTRANGGN